MIAVYIGGVTTVPSMGHLSREPAGGQTGGVIKKARSVWSTPF